MFKYAISSSVAGTETGRARVATPARDQEEDSKTSARIAAEARYNRIIADERARLADDRSLCYTQLDDGPPAPPPGYDLKHDLSVMEKVARETLVVPVEAVLSTITATKRMAGLTLTTDELAARVGDVDRHRSYNPLTWARTALLKKEYIKRATARETVEDVVTTGVSSHDCQTAILHWAESHNELLSYDDKVDVRSATFVAECLHKLGDMTVHTRGTLATTLCRVASQYTYGEDGKTTLDMAKVTPYFLRMVGDMPQLAHFRR